MAALTGVRMIPDYFDPTKQIPVSIADPSKPLREQSREIQAYEFYHNEEAIKFEDRYIILKECKPEISRLHKKFLLDCKRYQEIQEFEELNQQSFWLDRKISEFSFYHPWKARIFYGVSIVGLGLLFFSSASRGNH